MLCGTVLFVTYEHVLSLQAQPHPGIMVALAGTSAGAAHGACESLWDGCARSLQILRVRTMAVGTRTYVRAWKAGLWAVRRDLLKAVAFNAVSHCSLFARLCGHARVHKANVRTLLETYTLMLIHVATAAAIVTSIPA